MNRWIATIGAVTLACLAVSPAQAGWKLVEKTKVIKVAKSKLSVTPGENWNRNSSRPIKKGEVWTLDGVGLNEVYFVSGLAAGETLFKELDKKNNPLPKLGSSVSLTDIPEFYESSVRVALQTSLFEIEKVEPVSFAEQQGIRFSFNYGVKDSPIIRKGMAQAALVNGQLHLIAFVAPTIHYFERDLPKAEALMASAKL